jgi:hypothetical protein
MFKAGVPEAHLVFALFFARGSLCTIALIEESHA